MSAIGKASSAPKSRVAPAGPARRPSQVSRVGSRSRTNSRYSRLLAPGNQHGHRLGLGETGQIEEVAVLPVGVLDVVVAHAHRCGGNDGDGIAAHQLHQLAAAAGEFVTSEWRGLARP